MTETPAILTIGNFDGVHIGHRKLIDNAISLARSWGGRAVLMTFTPHPRQYFSPSEHFFIHPQWVHERILGSLGLDEVIYLPFGQIHTLSPKAFFDNIIQPLEPAAIVLGDNFNFGVDKSGNINNLRTLCASHDIALHSLPRAAYEDEAISSSRIRQAIQNGHIALANRMLGDTYTLYDTVVHGAGRGHTLGFATANIYAEAQVLPKLGVYATRLSFDGWRQSLPAVTAITRTPTFGEVKTVIETHVIDFHQDLYERPIQVSFESFLRDEMKFASQADLIEQLHRDVAHRMTLSGNIPIEFE